MMIRRISSRRIMFNHPAVLIGLAVITVFVVAGARADAPEPHGDADLTSSPPANVKLLASYDMSWWSVDGGGGSSSGGAFAVTGAIGQPDAGLAGGCGVVLEGGIWSGPAPCETPLFCNGFETGDVGAWTGVTP